MRSTGRALGPIAARGQAARRARTAGRCRRASCPFFGADRCLLDSGASNGSAVATGAVIERLNRVRVADDVDAVGLGVTLRRRPAPTPGVEPATGSVCLLYTSDDDDE